MIVAAKEEEGELFLKDIYGVPHPITSSVYHAMLGLGWLAFLLSHIFNLVFYSIHPAQVELVGPVGSWLRDSAVGGCAAIYGYFRECRRSLRNSFRNSSRSRWKRDEENQLTGCWRRCCCCNRRNSNSMDDHQASDGDTTEEVEPFTRNPFIS